MPTPHDQPPRASSAPSFPPSSPCPRVSPTRTVRPTGGERTELLAPARPRKGARLGGGPKVPVVSYGIAPRPSTGSVHGRVGQAQGGGSRLLGKEGGSWLVALPVVLGLGGEVARGAQPGGRGTGVRGLELDRRRTVATLGRGPAYHPT